MSDFRVVIIDDEAWTRDTIKRIGRWRELGFRIVGEASDGISGLACIRQLAPHLVITDMRMPGLDGVQLLQELQKEAVPPELVVISGFSDYTYTRQALASHAVDYLLKPIDPDEFNGVLRRCMETLKAASNTSPAEWAPPVLTGVDGTWIREYRETREGFRQSLDALSEQGIRESASRFKELHSRSSSANSLSVLVKMNHDLFNALEEQAITWLGESDPRFPPSLISFAVGEQKGIDEMLEHYVTIAADIINLRHAETGRQRRLDLRPLLGFLDQNYRETISLDDLSRDFAVSKEYLCSLFKKEIGCTITEYLTRLRMDKARDLITHYQLPLKKIPEMVGYMDVPHFYRSFKRHFGMTPGAFRDSSPGKNTIQDNAAR
ncbi:MAG: response regulator [Spirochaetaceae bacterium]|nr:MAG: response regulator [Spirochaetaceae bacterium]